MVEWMGRLLSCSLLFLVTLQFSNSNEILEYTDPNTCDDHEYFSTVQLQCIQCDSESYLQPSENKLTCECEKNTIIVSNIGEFPKCQQCPPQHMPSLDRRKCVMCENNSTEDGTCEICGGNSIQVDKDVDGKWLPVSRCVECSPDTTADKDYCGPCPFEVSSDDDSNPGVNCTCPPETHEIMEDSSSRIFCVSHRDLIEWPDEATLYTVKHGSRSIVSHYFQKNLRTSAYLCMVKSEEKACQALANLCAMNSFQMVTNEVGDVRRRIYGASHRSSSSPCQPFQPKSPSADQLPWIFYGETAAVLSRKKITGHYGMSSASRNKWLNVTAARYGPDGNFLGIGPVPLSKLSLCPEAAYISNEDFFRFGAPHKLSCELSMKALLSHPMEFIDLFLSYQDGNDGSSTKLYTLPILNYNLQVDGNDINQGNDESQWQLVRRMFNVDIISGKVAASESLTSIQYLKFCHIRVRMLGREGLIYPPLIRVQYGIINVEEVNATITTTLSIDYEQADGLLMKPVEVWSGILGSAAVLLAFIQSWSVIRRDFVTLPSSSTAPIWIIRSLVLHSVGHLADSALIIATAACIRTFVLYKGQSVPHITLPTVSADSIFSGGVPEEDSLIQTYIIVAFCLKCIEILHLLIKQSSVDIFFLDWERPRPSAQGINKKSTPPVSAWRMCFVANEWNELQAIRRTSTFFQIIGTLFFLKVIGLENWAAAHPDLTLDPPNIVKDSPPSLICHIGVGAIIYMAIYLLQFAFVIVYEHYGKNSIQEFVDLCSVTNISVLIFSSTYYGFYIHGRSAHGFADTDLVTLKAYLKKEAEEACGTRGLVPDGLERQTFRIAVPPSFRACYDRLLAITHSAAANTKPFSGSGAYPGIRRPSPSTIWVGRAAGDVMPSSSWNSAQESDQAFLGMNKFLSAFLDHALKDMDYEVRDKSFMETLLDFELIEPMEHGIFYNDNGHSFDNVLLYGKELTLAAFNLLTFMFIDAVSLDYIVAAILTVFLDKFVIWIRKVAGKKNVSRKALIDERFLI